MFLKIGLFKRSAVVLIFIVMSSMQGCATTQTGTVADKGKQPVNDNGSAVIKNEVKKYSELLVDIKSYSTNGAMYQERYQSSLLSMAGEIIEGQDLDVAKGSIGFYYDKKSARTDRLFLGVDINTAREGKLDYGRFSVKLIKENVGGLIDSIFRYRNILNENEVVGIVIGFRWSENGSPEQVNIWIKKEDIQLFHDGKITMNEMYQRSTITNSAGKIILLPI